jgi:UDP-2,4-diacetamido-2,4,6-trideoxy-beta-L-altropyranose hydrolase
MLVVDNYEIDYDFEKQIKYKNPRLKIFVLDDTYEKHFCDILLNHNVSAVANRYDDLVPGDCELRCGGEYTLLREEFYLEKLKPRPTNILKTVFVAMGGADHANKNIAVLKVLENIKNFRVNIVTTTANRYLEELQNYCNDRPWINLQINSNKVAQLIQQSDFAIVTPSVVVNEVYFMGLPFIAIKTAHNQKEIYSFLKRNNYTVLEEFDELELKTCIMKLGEK